MNTFDPRRRQLLQGLAGGACLTSLGGPALAAGKKPPVGRVVIVGAGFGGATAARYLRKWSDGQIAVTLIERNRHFISCPLSNEVLAGTRDIASLTMGYQHLQRDWGVQVVQATATAIDPERRRVRTDRAGEFAYDRLIMAPGFGFDFSLVEGYDEAAQGQILHAWKAGPQTTALRQQLAAMADGEVFVITIPPAPYRCPPGPYERACQVAWYFKHFKPRSKVLILDANDKIQSKEKLFQEVWANDYPGLIEYRPNWNAVAIDAATRTVISEFGDRQPAGVLNLLPPMRAAEIAHTAGLVNVNRRWCEVNWLGLESTAVPGIHVLGDALQTAKLMPKSGHMANQHGKAAAAAIVELLAGRPVQPVMMANTCYSMVDDRHAVHVASVHAYSREEKTMLPVTGAGGLSQAPSRIEGLYCHAWANSIWHDCLG